MKAWWIGVALGIVGCASTRPQAGDSTAAPQLSKLLVSIAGAGATNCGYVADQSEAIDAASLCAREAYATHRAFTLAWGSDAKMWLAFAGDSQGHVTQIWMSHGTVVLKAQCTAFEVTKEKGLHCSI